MTAMTTMPFGKYKGIPFAELELDYIGWMLDNTDLKDPLKTILQHELARRGPDGAPVAAPPPRPTTTGTTRASAPSRPNTAVPLSMSDGDVREIVRQELAAALRRVAATLEDPR